MRCFLSIGFILVVLHFLVPHASAQPLFEVERESFCRGVQDREPVNHFSNVAEIRKGEEVFLWMEIKGGERALTMLEAKGQMSIYHAWASEKGVIDIIDIGITKERWIELSGAMKNQFREQGFFTWRTYSVKRNFKEGRWYVSVLDANKKPVRKSGSGTEAFRPEIVIKFLR